MCSTLLGWEDWYILFKKYCDSILHGLYGTIVFHFNKKCSGHLYSNLSTTEDDMIGFPYVLLGLLSIIELICSYSKEDIKSAGYQQICDECYKPSK